jgi:hypothetical protein
MAAAAAKSPPRLDPANPDHAVKLHQKLWCSLEEGRPALLWSQGSVYGRRPGDADRKLFNFQIWNARACKSYQDPVRGYGYRSVSREIMLYLDPQTNALVKTWRNPWTDEIVEVIHTQNDPVNMSGVMYARDGNGNPTAKFDGRFVNGRVIFANEAPLYYDNPLGGGYQDYVGGHYHAMEMLNVFVYEKDLLEPKVKTLPRWSRSWKRVSNFLPWMRMGDRPGQLIFTAVGQRVNSVDDTNEPIRTALKTTFAKYQSPPSLDDTRPNETSWSYFRSIIKPGTPPVVGEQPPLIVPPVPTQSASAWEQDLRDNCARKPEEQLTTWWHGRVYSRRLDEKDRHIFDVERLRLSRCELLQDPVRGRGYQRITRELLVFTEKQTGQALTNWRNPWNGETVTAPIEKTPEAREPVRWERDANGAATRAASRFELTDKTLTGSDATIAFGDNPLGGDYQEYVGGRLQVIDYETSERPLVVPKKGELDQVLSWGQVRPWYPWMKMGSRDGMIVVHAAGSRLSGVTELPPALQQALAAFKGTDYRRPEDLVIQTRNGRESLYVATTTTERWASH